MVGVFRVDGPCRERGCAVLLDALVNFFNMLYAQIVNIPLEGMWDYLYVLLNLALLLVPLVV